MGRAMTGLHLLEINDVMSTASIHNVYVLHRPVVQLMGTIIARLSGESCSRSSETFSSASNHL